MNEMTHAELVRLAVVAVREDGGTKTAAELTALADRLETHCLVSREDVFEAELLADDEAEFFQLRGNHRSAAPFVELRDRLCAARGGREPIKDRAMLTASEAK